MNHFIEINELDFNQSGLINSHLTAVRIGNEYMEFSAININSLIVNAINHKTSEGCK